MSDSRVVANAKRLQELLDDPIVEGAHQAAARDMFRRFCEHGRSDQQLRDIYAEVQALARLHQQFRAIIGQGEEAAHRIASEKKEQARP